MDGIKAYILPGVAALVLGGYTLWSSTQDEPAPEDSEAAARGEAKPAESSPRARRGRPSPLGRDDDDPVARRRPDVPPVGVDPPSPAELERQAARDDVRERVTQAQRDRLHLADGEPIKTEGLGTLKKDYVTQRIEQDLMPLVKRCYDRAIEDEPDLQGRLVMSFTVVGEPGVGGLVEDVDLAESTQITNADMVECATAALETASFAPPSGGGTFEVTAPFTFRLDE